MFDATKFWNGVVLKILIVVYVIQNPSNAPVGFVVGAKTRGGDYVPSSVAIGVSRSSMVSEWQFGSHSNCVVGGSRTQSPVRVVVV